MQQITEKIKKYPLSGIVIVAIWVVCMIPVPETPLDKINLIDKWTHFAMYGTLTLTIWWEYTGKHKRQYWDIMKRYKKSRNFHWKDLLIGGMVCPIIMGGLVELAQAYLTTCRTGDWFDALCNALGVLLGCLIGTLLVKYRAS